MQDDRKPRRTRGPRTPDERAGDAAVTAATVFEKLPPSDLADGMLKPIAQLLRLTSAKLSDWPAEYVSLGDLTRFEEAERRFLETADEWQWLIEAAPVDKVVKFEVMRKSHLRGLRELKTRVAALTDQDV